jgi:hypothetical protein
MIWNKCPVCDCEEFKTGGDCRCCRCGLPSDLFPGGQAAEYFRKGVLAALSAMRFVEKAEKKSDSTP